MSKNGKVTRKGTKVSIIQASPDDQIYKRGYVIGARRLGDLSKGSQEKNSST